MMRKIVGNCPMGCGQTLSASNDGYLVCTFLECPRPTALDELLEDRETEHVIRFDPNGFFNVRHPLRERLDDQLLTCWVHQATTDALDEGWQPSGTYRAAFIASGVYDFQQVNS